MCARKTTAAGVLLIESRYSSEEPSPFRQFVKAHPWLFVLAWVVMIFPINRLIGHFLLSRVTSVPVEAVILETGLIVAAFVFLSLLGWWHDIGFTTGIRREDVLVCLFPTLLTVYIAWNALSSSTVGSMIFFFSIYACFVAVAAESSGSHSHVAVLAATTGEKQRMPDHAKSSPRTARKKLRPPDRAKSHPRAARNRYH